MSSSNGVIEIYPMNSFDHDHLTSLLEQSDSSLTVNFEIVVQSTGSSVEKTKKKRNPILCKVCGLDLKQKRHLEVHINEVHLNIKPHDCKQCTVGYFLMYLMTLISFVV